MSLLFCLATIAAHAQDPAAPTTPPAEPVPATPPPATPAAQPDMTAVVLLLQQLVAQQAAATAATQAPAVAEPAVVEPGTPTPDEAPAEVAVDSAQEGGSFGQTLDLLEKKISWSAYGDVILAGSADGLNFEATHFNPILGARMSEDLYSEMEIEFEDNGHAVKLEYGYVDWTPTPAVSLRIGQFLTPMGEFNEALHPSFRWNQVSRPRMFRDVMPAVWSDVGVQLFGEVAAGAVDVDWNVYAVNGLGGAWDEGSEEAIRPLRDRPDADGGSRIADNNFDKGLGGRVRMKAHPGSVKTMLSASAYTGAVEDDDTGRLVLLDVAGDLDARSVGVRVEAAQSLFEGQGFNHGAYVQVWAKVKKITPAVRLDVVQRTVGANDTDVEMAVSALYSVRPHWNLRAEGLGSLNGELAPSGTLMAAFFF